MGGALSWLFGNSDNCNKQFPAQNSTDLNGASGSKYKLIILEINRDNVEQGQRE